MTISSAKTAAAKPALQTIELQASSKTTQKMVAQPGQAFKIVVDGQVYTGQKKINNRALQLMRKGDALLLIAQDQAEPLLEVSGFYAPALDASADTPATDPSQAASYGPATETPADLQTLFESGSTTHLAAADLGATPAASTPSWGTLIAQAGGAVGTTTATTSAATAATTAAATTATAATATAAAVGAVSVGAVAAAVAIAAVAISSSNDDSPASTSGKETGNTTDNTTPAPTPRTYTIDAVFGPMTDGGANTSIYLYKADGTKLDGDGKATYANGKFTFIDTKGYAGVVIAKMVDGDTDPDYRDEATGEPKSANGVYLSVVDATGAGALKVSINPLTTAAAISMGVIPSTEAAAAPTIAADIKSADTTAAAAKVVSVNKAIAKAFNIVDDSGSPLDIATSTAQAVIAADGTSTAGTSNAYGRALAVVSQAEKATGLNTVDFAAQVAKALDTTTGSLTSKATAEATDASTIVQVAIVKGVASAQAEGQMTQTQSTAVVKAVTASDIAMVVKQDSTKDTYGNDSYLNASETTIDLVITGTIAAGQTLELLNGSTPINFAVGSGGAASSYTTSATSSITVTVLKTALLDSTGSNKLQAKLTSGATTSASNPLVIVVDSTVAAPNASFTDSTNGVTGNDADGVTNTTAITAPTNSETGAKVEYSITKGTGTASAWSTTYNAPPANGKVDDSYKVEVRQTDLAGNQAIQTLTFTLDSTKPAAPDAALTQDTAAGNTTNNDGITQNGAITAPTNTESGTTKVEYRVTKGLSGTPGSWTTTYTVPTVDDDYKVEVRQTDKAGNVGDVQTISFKLDKTNPSISTTSMSVAENATSVGNVVGSDANTIKWALDGSGADDSKFTLTEGGVLALKAGANFEVPGSAANSNAYTVKVKATDAAGNASTKDITVNVTNVNEAPTGTNATITIDEDLSGGRALTASDFGFTDATGETGALSAVIITTLPTAGTLKLGTDAVTLNQVISKADLDLNKLVYTPAQDANGTAYTTIGFKVKDNGGTANTGDVDTSANANTLTFDVTAVNDAPVNTVPSAKTVDEDTNLAITGLSVADVDAGSSPITVTLSVAKGTITVAENITNGLASGGIATNGTGSVVLTGTLAAINATLAGSNGVVYKGNKDYNGADTLTVLTNDGGNTGSGNAKTDSDTVAITVNAVNDAPTSTALANGVKLPAATFGRAYADYDAKAGLQISDVDGDTLTYSLVGAPSWLSISNSGVISGTAPALGATGAPEAGDLISFKVKAADASLSTEQTVTLNIYNNPQITSITRATTANVDATSGNTNTKGAVDFLITFNKAELSFNNTDTVGAGDFTVTFTPAAGGASSTVASNDLSIAGSGNTRTLTVAGTAVAALGDGTLAVTAVTGIKDSTGNDVSTTMPTGASNQSYVLDYVKPATPNAQLTTDTTNSTDAAFATDNITSSAAITPASNIETNAKVEYRVTKGASGTPGNWTTTYTVPTVDDDYKVEIRQTDRAGNASDIQTINFTLDSTKPAVPNAQLTTDSGTSDGITNSGAITAPTNTESGTTKVEYRVTKGLSGTAGSWSTTYTSPTVDDDYKVEVRQTDKAGNVGDAQTINYKLDTTQPVVTTSAFSTNENTGADIALRSFTLAATDASTVTWSFDNSMLDGALFSLSGNTLSFAGVRNFESAQDTGADNVYDVNVTATDAAGLQTTQKVSVTVNNVNEAPTVANAIANQTFVVGGAADSFVVPANAFSDVDANTTLTYSATLADGSDLPSWLSFDASSRTFSGNPTANGTTTVKVTASDGSLSVSDEFVITAVTAPVLSTKLGVATQLDVRSKIVLSVDQDVNLNDSGTYTITINNTANTTAGTPDSAIKNGFRSETTDHDQVITITNGVVSGDGTITIDHVNNKIIIDPSFDLDLSNNYTLSVSTGAFKAVASGQASQAFTDVNFSTVTPGVGLAAAVQAQEMSTTSGELQDSLKWFDASNIGSPSGNPSPLDFVAGDYAAALKYLTNDPTIEGDANMLLKNFGASDLVYFDNQNHALSNPQTVMNNNAFSQGVGTPADPFGLVVAGTGDLTSVFVYIEVATGITLPDLSNDMLISTVISNGWSNTGMVIVA